MTVGDEDAETTPEAAVSQPERAPIVRLFVLVVLAFVVDAERVEA